MVSLIMRNANVVKVISLTYGQYNDTFTGLVELAEAAPLEMEVKLSMPEDGTDRGVQDWEDGKSNCPFDMCISIVSMRVSRLLISSKRIGVLRQDWHSESSRIN